MDTNTLEQQAMNKIYNNEEPNELFKKEEETEKRADKYSLVPEILKRHGEDLVIKLPFYATDFSYLVVKDSSWQWHFLKFFNNTYGMILPIEYLIEYSSTFKNSKEHGFLTFRKEKEYTLEYTESTLEEFYSQMKELGEVFSILEDFQTENNQIFREYEKDSIYMYQDGYVFKLSGYSRNDITEYYDMYLLLMSLHPLTDGNYTNNNYLKYIYLVSKHSLDYLYKGVDLKKKRIAALIEMFQGTMDMVTISLDNKLYGEIMDLDYSLSMRRKCQEKEMELPITITHKEKWFFDGNLSLGLFGNYLRGELFEFPSILSSQELSEPEKKELIKKVVMEKKQECLEKKTYLDNQFLYLFFKKRLDDASELFEKERWDEFLKLESLSLEELSPQAVKQWFLQKIQFLRNESSISLEDKDEWKDLCSYINFSILKSKVMPLYLTITPLFIVFEYSIFGNKENYILTEEHEVIEWL